MGGDYAYYLFTHPTSNQSFFMDAKYAGNESRFINDFRNTGKQANVRFVRKREDDGWVVEVVSTTHIAEGEELLTDYGPVFWDC